MKTGTKPLLNSNQCICVTPAPPVKVKSISISKYTGNKAPYFRHPGLIVDHLSHAHKSETHHTSILSYNKELACSVQNAVLCNAIQDLPTSPSS